MDEITEEGLVNLVAAMIRLATQDMRYGSSDAEKDAVEFINSEWFCLMCEGMGSNPYRVKHMMLNKSVTWRKRYE